MGSGVLVPSSYDDSHSAALPLLQVCSNGKTILTSYLLCISPTPPPPQVLKVPTCSSTTCPRSLETRTYCRCSCLSEMWSLPKSSSTNRQTLASASVRQQKPNRTQMPEIISFSWLCPKSGAGLLLKGTVLKSEGRQVLTVHKRWTLYQSALSAFLLISEGTDFLLNTTWCSFSKWWSHLGLKKDQKQTQ